MVDTLLQAQLSLIILLLIIGEKVGVEALFSISALIDGWSLLRGA